MFTLTGHRGAMGVEPENTMRSFRRAVRDGADEIELDLRVTRDGHLVICHDASIDRTTDGSGLIEEMSLAQIRVADAGHGEPVPTFAEVIGELTTPLQAEIKAAAAVDELVSLLSSAPELWPRVTPASFDRRVVAELAQRLPAVPVALITHSVSEALIDEVTCLRARKVFCGWDGLAPEFVERAHGAGLTVTGWPAPGQAEVERAFDLGLDGVTSDFPGALRPLVDARLTAAGI